LKGRHGLDARSRLMERSRLVEREIRALEAVRVRLEREIKLLDEDRPDPDFIDELARQVLGFASPSDRLIVTRSERAAGR
jgi:cell division protein FtsB